MIRGPAHDGRNFSMKTEKGGMASISEAGPLFFILSCSDFTGLSVLTQIKNYFKESFVHKLSMKNCIIANFLIL